MKQTSFLENSKKFSSLFFFFWTQRIGLPRFRTSLPLTVPCSACLRSTAARRLAQNAPPEHFAGFQPSLPRTAPSVVLNLGRCKKHHLLCIWGLAHFFYFFIKNKTPILFQLFLSEHHNSVIYSSVIPVLWLNQRIYTGIYMKNRLFHHEINKLLQNYPNSKSKAK